MTGYDGQTNPVTGYDGRINRMTGYDGGISWVSGRLDHGGGGRSEEGS